MTRVSPEAIVGTDQMPVALSKVPKPVAPVKSKPTGSWSVTSTFVAAKGPSLVRESEKLTVEPKRGFALLTVLTSERSAVLGATEVTNSSA